MKGNSITAYYKNGKILYQKGLDGDAFYNKNGEKIVESNILGSIFCFNKGQRKPLPKEKIFDAMALINKTSVKAPIKIGDIVVKDIFGLGINIVATKDVSR